MFFKTKQDLECLSLCDPHGVVPKNEWLPTLLITDNSFFFFFGDKSFDASISSITVVSICRIRSMQLYDTTRAAKDANSARIPHATVRTAKANEVIAANFDVSIKVRTYAQVFFLASGVIKEAPSRQVEKIFFTIIQKT